MFKVVPASFLTCLNAMCFLSRSVAELFRSFLLFTPFLPSFERKPHCIGENTLKACKILKWLWLEEELADHLLNKEKLMDSLKNFQRLCRSGISMFQFITLAKEIVQPTLQFLDTSTQIISNILHLQVSFEDNQWVLKNLSLASTEDRLIVNLFHGEVLKKVSSLLHFPLFFLFFLFASSDSLPSSDLRGSAVPGGVHSESLFQRHYFGSS
jgi:hypothetical protein